jgi:hypothetical protein
MSIAIKACCPTTDTAAACKSCSLPDAILERGQELAKIEADASWDPTELDPDGQPWAGEPEPTLAFEPIPEDDTDYREWQSESAAREHLDAGERLTLAELVDRQTDFYWSWGNPAGEMLARAMDELALKVRMTDATTPAEFAARADELEDANRETWEAVGYDAGRESCRCGPGGSAFGHMA